MYAQRNWETQLNHHGQLKRKRRLPTRRWELKSFVTSFSLKAQIARILMNKATGPSFLPCFGRNFKTLWLCSPVWYEGSLIQESAPNQHKRSRSNHTSLFLSHCHSLSRSFAPPNSPPLPPMRSVISIFLWSKGISCHFQKKRNQKKVNYIKPWWECFFWFLFFPGFFLHMWAFTWSDPGLVVGWEKTTDFDK